MGGVRDVGIISEVKVLELKVSEIRSNDPGRDRLNDDCERTMEDESLLSRKEVGIADIVVLGTATSENDVDSRDVKVSEEGDTCSCTVEVELSRALSRDTEDASDVKGGSGF